MRLTSPSGDSCRNIAISFGKEKLHCVPKNESRLVSNIFIVVSMLQRNLARDILMALAIKRVHNLPPHLSYVSTLP